ncbi:hypothetical protein NMY22_g14769 [Coprinellus aureogranulatus]|nr:hypothetical protein NMY22_g14769 [Coprinellus aureogranulatus]
MPSPLPHFITLRSTSSSAKITVELGHQDVLNMISGFQMALQRSCMKPLSIVIVRRPGSASNTIVLEAVTTQVVMMLLDGEWSRVRSLTVHTHLRSSLAPACELIELRCLRSLENLEFTYEVDDSDDQDD